MEIECIHNVKPYFASKIGQGLSILNYFCAEFFEEIQIFLSILEGKKCRDVSGALGVCCALF